MGVTVFGADGFLILFCSDGERAENSTKQAELLGGYTTYGGTEEPTEGILRVHPLTGYGHVIHIRGTTIRGRPEAARRAYQEGCSTSEATRNWRREHSLEAEWAGAGLYCG